MIWPTIARYLVAVAAGHEFAQGSWATAGVFAAALAALVTYYVRREGDMFSRNCRSGLAR